MKGLILLLAFVPITLWGSIQWEKELSGGFSAQIDIPTTSITVEDLLPITLTLSYPETHTPDLDTIRMNLLKYVGLSEPPFALVDEKIKQEGKKKLKATFILEPQVASLQFISLYNIPFLSNDGNPEQTKNIVSDIFQVEVALPKVEKDFYGLSYPLLPLTEQFPISLSSSNRKHLIESKERFEENAQKSAQIIKNRTFPWASLAGAFLFVLFLLIARMQPEKRADLEKQKQKIALSAKEKALKSLEKMTEQSLKGVPYYMGINETVRKYIEERFQLNTTTQTTQEFLHSMASHPAFDRETQAMLSDFMICSDKIKFAEATPTKEECDQAKQMAYQFIDTDS